MLNSLSTSFQRYRVSLIATSVVALIGLSPEIVSPLARAYMALCARYLTDAPPGHHYPPLLVAFLGPVMAALALGVFIALVRQWRAQRHLDAVAVERSCSPSPATLRLVHSLGLDGYACYVDDEAVYAFCGGLLHPRVYLSRGLLELLTAEEIEAVLRHERRHVVRRDPLRFFASDLVRQLAAFFPIVTTLADRVRINAELAADRDVLSVMPTETLASALVKVMHAPAGSAYRVSSAGLSPTEARVAALLGRPVDISIDRRDALVSLVFAVSVVAVLGWLAMQPVPMPLACSSCSLF